ncbi:helix-turn-helix domain-containing protein, partial [Neisseria sp. P0019.S002]|uniref:helix-turn-helix domain-containing protein n=1 Tax=Neisseria sp. P0019.S002 TaxID=3436798 RepID=UPI003F7D8F68
ALEKGEYSGFPGLVFVSGYLRSYARFLKINEQTIAKPLRSITPQLEDHVYAVTRSANTGLSYKDTEKQGLPKWILGVAALALAAGGVHFWQSKSSFENEQANIQNSKDVAETMKTPALKTDNVAVSEMTEDGKKEITNKSEAANDQAVSAAAAVVQEEKPAVKV